jgi:hypothetical protein
MVGVEHRAADLHRKRAVSIETTYDVIDGLRAKLGLPPVERRALRERVPDYNKARKLDALCARRRELGWDFECIYEGGFNARLVLVPVTDDAVPPRVIEEVNALWRMSGTDNFTRRVRAA